MNLDLITQEIPVFAAILTSTVLILRFLSDNRRYAMERQQEIKKEIEQQVKRDAASESQGKDLLRLSVEFHEFRNEIRKELNFMKDTIITLQNLIKELTK